MISAKMWVSEKIATSDWKPFFCLPNRLPKRDHWPRFTRRQWLTQLTLRGLIWPTLEDTPTWEANLQQNCAWRESRPVMFWHCQLCFTLLAELSHSRKDRYSPNTLMSSEYTSFQYVSSRRRRFRNKRGRWSVGGRGQPKPNLKHRDRETPLAIFVFLAQL